MKITIKEAEILDNKPIVSIWFEDKQIILETDEYEDLKENIKLFENNETALEVQVQEQQIKVIIEGQLKKFRTFQSVLTSIQVITVILLILNVLK